jgi:hypothetical protein
MLLTASSHTPTTRAPAAKRQAAGQLCITPDMHTQTTQSIDYHNQHYHHLTLF